MVSVEVREGLPVRVRSRSGRVRVTAEPRGDLLVASGDASVDEEGVLITAPKGGSGGIEFHCPEGTALTIGTASGSLELTGMFGRVTATTASGHIRVDGTTAADLRTASGSAEVGTCAGLCRIKTVSGNVAIGRAGLADVSTVSGRVNLGSIGKSLRVSSASGRVEVGCEGATDAHVKTISGAVTIRFPEGVRPAARLRSMTGKRSLECETGDDCNVDVTTFSGRIEVVPR